MAVLTLASNLKLPIDAITQTFLIVGKRGSGKSNTAARLVEQFHAARLPFVVLDPVDTWWGLKAGRSGGRGLDVYVFGGRHQDLPLEAHSGALLADVLCEHRASMVLSVKHLSGRERSTFVRDFTRTLFQKWFGGPLHVVLEEAHELAPQNVQTAREGEQEMLGAIKRLWKLARASGIGGSAVTQRPASLSKDITTQSEILIAHRTIGPQDVKAIGEWVKYHGERLDLLAELPSLPTGEAFVWAPEFPEGKPIGLQRTAILLRDTYDSASTPKVGEQRVEPKELAPVDLERLRTKMAATIEKAKAEDPRELKRQLTDLKQQLANKEAVLAEVDTRTKRIDEKLQKVRTTAVLNDADRDLLALVAGRIREAQEELTRNLVLDVNAAVTAMTRELRDIAANAVEVQSDARDTFMKRLESKGLQKILAKLEGVASTVAPTTRTERSTDLPSSVIRQTPSRPRQQSIARGDPLSNGNLPKVERVFLSVLAQRVGKSTTRNQLAVFAGYSAKSRHVDNTISSLRTKAYVEGSSSALAITDAGQQALGSDFEPLPQGQALIDYWIANAGGAAEAAMLRVLVSVYPKTLSRDELAEASNYSVTSRHVDNTVSRLRTLELLSGDRHAMKASDELFA